MSNVAKVSDSCFHYVIGDEYLVIDMESNGRNRQQPISRGYFHTLFFNCPVLPLYWKQYRIQIYLTICFIGALIIGKSINLAVGTRIGLSDRIAGFYWIRIYFRNPDPDWIKFLPDCGLD